MLSVFGVFTKFHQVKIFLETNLNDESLVHDINNIVKEQQKNLTRIKNSDQKLGMVSPGSQRWNLQRKDSMHSLASEPARTDLPTHFQRGAKSHSSLHRLIILFYMGRF